MKKNIKNIIALVLLWAVSCVALAANVSEDPLQRRMLDIAGKLRCTVCQNQPVAESNSGLARDMRSAITEKLKAGQTEQEIVQFFVDRYGDYVLLEPPKSGNGIVLWIFPPAFLLLVIMVVIFIMKSRSNKKTIPPLSPLSVADQERIRHARKEMDESGESK